MTGDAAPWGDGGAFGWWDRDAATGVDVFRVAPALAESALVTPPGGVGGCWHPVANRELTAAATVDGGALVWSARRGVVRFTGAARAWTVDGLVPGSLAATWGPAYAEWRFTGRGGAEGVRRMTAVADDRAAVRIDVALGPPLGDSGPAWISEGLDLDPRALLVGGLMSPRTRPPADLAVLHRWTWRAMFAASALCRSVTDGLRRALSVGLVQRVDDDGYGGLVVRPRCRVPAVPPERPAWFDRALPVLALVPIPARPGDPVPATVVDTDRRWPVVRIDVRSLPVGDDGWRRAAVALVLGHDDAEVGEVAAAVADAEPDEDARRWGSRLRLVADPGDAVPTLGATAREAAWHAVQLIGTEQPDDWFGARYPAQGSAYGYIHGLQGAPRDYALSAVPLAFVDPPAARQALVVMARMTRPDGEMAYAHTGRGRTTSGGIHSAPTDLALFWLWALTEYVWATGDRRLLDEDLPFDPATAGRATSRQRVVLAYRYLRDRVGTGPHGLVRVGSGDWADPISAMVSRRRAFHRRGESTFNTAMAVFVLGRAADLIEDSHGREAAEMRSFSAQLARALAPAWNGSWFLRGYDGRGGPVGDRHLFLDAQAWCLIAGIGSPAQRRRLMEAIDLRCGRPSPVGATILDRPHPVRLGMLAPGWDVNGGVWAAINGLLAWGFARHDPQAGWRYLVRSSLAAHARAYPHVWYGIWSGPDAYNGHFGSRAGETFVQPATPMAEFPVMNSNAHAGPLLALLRVLGLETTPAGVVVRPWAPGLPAWRLRCALGEWSAGPAPARSLI